MHYLIERKFLVLLVTMSVLIVAYPPLHEWTDTRIAFDILIAIVYGMALFALFLDRILRWLALALGVPTLIGIWADYALPGVPRPPAAIAFHIVAALFLSLTVVTILRVIFRGTRVSTDSVCGAFAGYMLIALMFGHVFCVVELLSPGSFQGDAEILEHLREDGSRFNVLTYFSFSTITTLGFGDVLPVRGGARGLSVVEAIMGQFYLAVLVAQLIGRSVSQATAARASHADGPVSN